MCVIMYEGEKKPRICIRISHPKWDRILLISFVVESVFKVAARQPIRSVDFGRVQVQT